MELFHAYLDSSLWLPKVADSSCVTSCHPSCAAGHLLLDWDGRLSRGPPHLKKCWIDRRIQQVHASSTGTASWTRTTGIPLKVWKTPETEPSKLSVQSGVHDQSQMGPQCIWRQAAWKNGFEMPLNHLTSNDWLVYLIYLSNESAIVFFLFGLQKLCWFPTKTTPKWWGCMRLYLFPYSIVSSERRCQGRSSWGIHSLRRSCHSKHARLWGQTTKQPIIKVWFHSCSFLITCLRTAL